eukprot:TRINITY_DN1742_c0_g1_i1.p1 TRINITY_DN1742_c0_g1~~TRINITY_DN1742_c0_g1_i1.p1  ORF type:complete len:103 (+),score=23.35 TRINITY_DN1742_c0_g1_i1:48-356(+)
MKKILAIAVMALLGTSALAAEVQEQSGAGARLSKLLKHTQREVALQFPDMSHAELETNQFPSAINQFADISHAELDASQFIGAEVESIVEKNVQEQSGVDVR